MQSGKLISLLKTFNKDELKGFGEFVSSPYFNKNSNILKLLEYIKKYSANYESSHLEKGTAYSKIFNGRKYNDKVMKNLMTETLRLGERFLEQTRYEKNKAGRYNYLLEELLDRKLYPAFKSKVKNASEYCQDLKKDEVYFYNNVNLYSIKHDYELKTKPGIEKIHEDTTAIDYLISYFLVWYFKYCYNLLNRKQGYNFKADLNFIESVIEYLRSRDFENKSIIMMYYYIFMINFKPEEENYFAELRNLIENHIILLTRTEKYNIYIAAQSYCMRKIAGGDLRFRHAFFEISKDMISNDAFYGTGGQIIHPLVYKSIVKAGVHAGEFGWTFDFINSYRQKLQPAFQHNIYHFCLAYCNFFKKDYAKSQYHLSIVQYENVYDKIELKRLLMQIYYESGLTEELISQADTFKHFLHNDKLVAEDQKKINLNFINFLTSLYKIKIQNDNHINPIRNKVETRKTYEKIWLLEKISELET